MTTSTALPVGARVTFVRPLPDPFAVDVRTGTVVVADDSTLLFVEVAPGRPDVPTFSATPLDPDTVAVAFDGESGSEWHYLAHLAPVAA